MKLYNDCLSPIDLLVKYNMKTKILKGKFELICQKGEEIWIPECLSGLAPAFGLERDPGALRLSPTLGSLHGAWFSLCLCLCLSLSLYVSWLNKYFLKIYFNLSFFKNFIYLFERVSQRAQVGGIGRERGRSRLSAEQGPPCRACSQDPEIMTWTKDRYFFFFLKTDT